MVDIEVMRRRALSKTFRGYWFYWLLVPCLSRGDVTAFAPGDSADPRYGDLFREALAAGVEVLPLRYRFSAEAVSWLGVAELIPREPQTLPA